MAEGYDGVKYLGNDKWSVVWQLDKAEKAIGAFAGKTETFYINEAIELYNIQKVINAGAQLELLDEAKINVLKESVKSYKGICAKFFSGITDENIAMVYGQLWFQYRDDFWELFDNLSVYKHISAETFISLIRNDQTSLKSVLKFRNTVNVYDPILADYIRGSNEAIDLIIMHFFGDEKEKLYFPKALAPDEYDNLFLKYTEWDGANANHLMLLFNAQYTKECPISDKMRLAAKRAYKKFWQNRKNSSINIDVGLGISFADIPQISKVEQRGKNQLITYDLKWLEENLDYPTILNNFIYVFEQADLSYRSNLPAFSFEMNAVESALTYYGKKMYRISFRFSNKHKIYNGQMKLYYRLLESRGIQLEDVFGWFFTEYLPAEFDVKGFVFNPPSKGISWLDKYKSMVSEMDAVVKQYNMYLEDGCIDRELFEMSSSPVRISELPSYLGDKYAYPASDVLLKEINALFSDQSLLSYTEKTKDNYRTLYKLLTSDENMAMSDFMPYQVDGLNWLIKRGSIYISDDGILCLDSERCFLLKDLYKYDVLCPRYCGTARKIVDDMKSAGELEYASTLFSRPEQEYFNFVMNKSEYVNGMDLRNKYLHGTYTTNVEMQQNDYIELLKIMVMLIIKMNEEFIIREKT
ncbi:MAG: hypothetical protein LIO81_12215 [Clostridiales bacterium]|nr:hypothetical protein [Clostridiales bacterium]